MVVQGAREVLLVLNIWKCRHGVLVAPWMSPKTACDTDRPAPNAHSHASADGRPGAISPPLDAAALLEWADLEGRHFWICTHVNLDVQLFSLVVWGTLIVQNRADADVKLRSTCVTIMDGGRLIAGAPGPVHTRAERAASRLEADRAAAEPRVAFRQQRARAFDVGELAHV